MGKLINLTDQEELVPTSKFPFATFPFENFNCVQSRVFDIFEESSNAIIAAPTAVGKTACAEMFLSHEVRKRGGKGMYLAPLKALSQEKIDDWTHEDHHFKDLKISICTGDYRITSERKAELDSADIIIMSTEMLNARCRNHKAENNEFLKKIGTLAVDECFPYKTPVRIDDNVELPIGRVVEDESIKELLSYDETTNKVVKKKILRKICRDRVKPLVSVKHENGSFTCTEDHKIWTSNRGYVKAKDLTTNDILKYIPRADDNICRICKKECGSKGLTAHYLYGHLSPGGNTFHVDNKTICKRCNKQISVYGYPSHLKYCGKEKKKYTPKTNVCKFCGKTFPNATIRARHESHHFRTSESYYKASETRAKSEAYWESMKLMGLKRTGKNNPIFRNEESYKKFLLQGKVRWESLTNKEKEEQIRRFVNAPLNKNCDTKLEIFLEDVLKENKLAARKTSGGKFWLTFKNGKRKNPDFKVNQQRKVIEVGDVEYWHTHEEIKKTVDLYKEIGYTCLYLTNEDIKLGKEHVKNSLINFIDNHASKVISVKKWGRGGVEKVYDLEIEDTHNYFASGVLVSNCHLLTVPGRGDHLESGLIKYSQLNPDGRFIFLSATMPNVNQIGEWLCCLTKKDTNLLISKYRPCPLYMHYETYWDGAWKYEDKELEKVKEAVHLVNRYPEDKFLIFVHGKKTGNFMLQSLKRARIDAEFHNADLDKKKRIALETRFKEDPDFRVLVATSTIAWGCNLPARRVIILGVHRGMEEIPTYDVTQMCVDKNSLIMTCSDRPYKRAEEIKIGEHLCGFDAYGKLVARPVLKIFKSRANARKIAFSNGDEIIVSNHPILLWNNSWCNSNDLKIDDKVCIASSSLFTGGVPLKSYVKESLKFFDFFVRVVDEEKNILRTEEAFFGLKRKKYVHKRRKTGIIPSKLAHSLSVNVRYLRTKNGNELDIEKINYDLLPWVFGILATDGNLKISKTNTVVRLSVTDEKISDRFRLFLKLSGLKYYSAIRKRGGKKDYYVTECSSYIMANIFKEMGITPKKTRTIDVGKLVNLPTKEVAGFLLGVIDGDGHVGKSLVRICTASKIFAEQIKLMLLRCGFCSTIKFYKGPGNVMGYKADTSHYIVSVSSFVIGALAKLSNINPIKGLDVVGRISIKNTRPKKGDLFYTKVKSIEDVGETDLVNFSVDECNTFFVNGIATHNCGRAGRPKYDPCGDVYVLLPQSNFGEQMARLNNPQRIMSQMLGYKVLAFHIVSEIHHGGVKTAKDIDAWYKQTLASFQAKSLDGDLVDKMVTSLERCGAIKNNDGVYEATSVGKIASMFYYSPYDVADLYKNFKILFSNKMENNDYWISMALSNIDSQRDNIVSKSERESMGIFERRVDATPGIKNLSSVFLPQVLKCGFCYYNLLHGEDNITLSGMMQGLKFDFERLKEVLVAIDSMAGKWGRKAWFDKLAMRVRYGVQDNLLEICTIPGIGKAKASKLWDFGLKSLKDISENPSGVAVALNCKKNKADEISSAAKLIISQI